NFFIKNENKELVGMLCINVNTSDYEYLNATIKRILGIRDDQDDVEYKMDSPIPVLSNSIETAVKESIKVALIEMGCPDYMAQSRLTSDEKMMVVKKLQEKGIFNVKGSITFVAKELNSSEPTIYRYLKKI
ncbi:MAG: helix-turn-helix domain-containing protein, partial [Erysipelotrichaceae bacterium]|nr:helix-turn-helix domain-containing protein [Erysipelotrichaceae bacterium]